MIEITVGQIIFGSVSIIFLLGIIQFLILKWLFYRLESSIKHEYDKKLEEYKFDQLQRQKAETIAKLFSKWIKYHGNEETYLSEKELIDFYEDLNRMSLEISLWLKDDKILSDIMARLQLKVDAKDIRTLTGDIRKIIIDKKDNFDPIEIILWPNSEIEEKLFNKKRK